MLRGRLTTHAVWLAAVLAAATMVRLWGIADELPFVYYGDELHMMTRSLGFGTGDLNPHWFHKPAFYMYVLFVEYGGYYLVGRVAGLFGGVEDFAVHFLQDKTVFAMLGRLTSAAAGVGCVVATYLIGRRAYDKRVGLVAAGLLAVMVAHVRSSHYVKADQLAACFGLFATLYILRLADTGRWRDYLLAGMFIGLGTGTKYIPVLLSIPLFVAHVVHWWPRETAWWKKLAGPRLWAAAGMVVLAFFVSSPYNFLDSFWFRENVLPLLGFGGASNMYKIRGPFGEQSIIERLWRWGRVIFGGEALGPALATVGTLGVVVALVRRKRHDVVVLACIAVMWLGASALWHVYEAWLLNGLYPYLCLGAAVVVVGAVRWAAAKVGALQGREGIVIAVAAMALAAPSAWRSAVWCHRLALPETRTLACRWVEANLPPSSRMLVDEHGPQISPNPASLQPLLDRAREIESTTPFTHHLSKYYEYRICAARTPSFYINEISHLWWREAPPENGLVDISNPEDADFGNPVKLRGALPLREYVAQGYEYAVICGKDYGQYLGTERGKRFKSVRKFYEDVMSQGTLLHEAAASNGACDGPTVRVYRLPTRVASDEGGDQ